MKTSFRRFSVSLLTLLALTFSTVGVTSVHAVGAVVINTNDSGAGSLRQTIADAGVGDTITFDSSLSGGTIYLASTLILTKNVNIDGSALTTPITLSGDSDNNGTGDVQVLRQTSALVTVTLNSLVVTKGYSDPYSGGGIYNSGTMTITNSTIKDNSSSYNPTISGGGIHNDGTMTITNSTITDNHSDDGGAINNHGTMTITNSTISGNFATYAGAIDNQGTLTMRNDTISGNSNYYEGSVHVWAGGTLNYSNTIIANSTGRGSNCANNGTIGINVRNLVEDGSCSSALSGDPNLDVLASNGGSTQTFALLTGSPAIDKGDDTTCANDPVNGLDQRGINRLMGAHCDIGAFETDGALTSSLTFSSIAEQDGWVLESSENSNTGGSTNATTSTFRLGDNAANKQYRSILSFNTSSIPDTATILVVTLNIKKQSIVGSFDPVFGFGGFMADVKNGAFGSSALETIDFQTATNKKLGPFKPTPPANNIYSIDLTGGKTAINKLETNDGLTQIRLRLYVDDNNNAIGNYINLYSGNTGTPSNRPQLVIKYIP